MRQLVEHCTMLVFTLSFYKSNNKNHCYFFVTLYNILSVLYSVFERIDFEEYNADVLMMNRIIYIYFAHYLYKEIDKEFYSSRKSDISIKLLNVGKNITPFLYRILYIQCLSYLASVYFVSLMNIYFPEFSFELLQLEFNEYHQRYGNKVLHLITELGSLISIFGILDKSSILYINHLTSIQLTFFAYYCTKYSVGITNNKWEICLDSAITVYSAISLFRLFKFKISLKTFHYFIILLCFVLVQELSHIIYDEEALMYHYDENNSFVVNFLLHGFFFIPLVTQLFKHHRV